MSWYECLLQVHGITIEGVIYRYYPTGDDDGVIRAVSDESGLILIKIVREGEN